MHRTNAFLFLQIADVCPTGRRINYPENTIPETHEVTLTNRLLVGPRWNDETLKAMIHRVP